MLEMAASAVRVSIAPDVGECQAVESRVDLAQLTVEMDQRPGSDHAHGLPIWTNVRPPSIVTISPVMYPAAGEQRKTTALAQSSGAPMRDPGIRE